MGKYRFRILMLNNEFPPLGGGMGTVNRALFDHLARVPDLEIDLITSAMGKRYEEKQFAEHIRILKVPVNNRNIHHSSNIELIAYAIRALPLALKLHRKTGYDFCFAWSAVPAGGVALPLHRLVGLNFLVRVCGPDIPGFERRYERLYPLLTPFIRAVWHGAKTVVAKCESEAEMIRAVDSRVNVSIVPNGVDISAFQPGDPIPEKGPLRILCVGRLIDRKGQKHLIRAVRQLTDHNVDVVLDLLGTGDSLQHYQALAQQYNVAELVKFHGYVSRGEIAKYYSKAHVFALPSYNEGMSVATLEAMAAGLPVVVTKTGGMEELVEEGVNGFMFDWADVDELTAHLRRLAINRAKAQEMGNASRVRAANFSWDRIASTYDDLMRKLSG